MYSHLTSWQFKKKPQFPANWRSLIAVLLQLNSYSFYTWSTINIQCIFPSHQNFFCLETWTSLLSKQLAHHKIFTGNTLCQSGPYECMQHFQYLILNSPCCFDMMKDLLNCISSKLFFDIIQSTRAYRFIPTNSTIFLYEKWKLFCTNSVIMTKAQFWKFHQN